MIFWSYDRGKEYWIAPDVYEVKKTQFKKKKIEWERKNHDAQRRYVKRLRANNPERYAQCVRRASLRRTFKKYDGSSYERWIASIQNPIVTLTAIYKLEPKQNQTLAELIHELSGYPIKTCEKIANPEL